MVVEHLNHHPRGLSLKTKERIYVLRKADKLTWEQIASKVKNLQGDPPYWKVVRDAYWELSGKKGPKKYNYSNCGRSAILTGSLSKWLIDKMKALRKKGDCTSNDLQRCLARQKHVTVEESTIRRVLNKEGYYYLPRAKKPKYDSTARAIRVDFATPFAKCTAATQQKKVNMCIDGVVFTRPPAGTVARENYINTDIPMVQGVR